MRYTLVTLFTIGIFVLSEGGLSAWALIVKQNLAERARQADSIVVGTVTHQQSQWRQLSGNRSRGFIVTDVTIQISEAWKYPSGELAPIELVVRVPGGRIGKLVMRASEIPLFHDQERVVLLLHKKPKSNIYRVSGGTLGVFRIVDDPKSGQEILANESGEFLVNIEALQFEKSPDQLKRITLDQFREYLKDIQRGEGNESF